MRRKKGLEKLNILIIGPFFAQFDDFRCLSIKNVYEKVAYIKIMYEICDI